MKQLFTLSLLAVAGIGMSAFSNVPQEREASLSYSQLTGIENLIPAQANKKTRAAEGEKSCQVSMKVKCDSAKYVPFYNAPFRAYNSGS